MNMRPEQLKDAIQRKLPLVIPAGVIEYHGPHLPIGTDVLVPDYICSQVEKHCECVIAPSIAFGPTLSWAGSADEGEMDFAPEPLFLYAREMLRHFVSMGFKRIYMMQYHQGAEGLQALCLRRAAAETIREETQKYGSGWGRSKQQDWPNPTIFEMIQIAGLDTFSHPDTEKSEMIIGHAGQGETQLLLAAYPETVRMESLSEWDEAWPDWLLDANLATAEAGRKWLDYCIEGWVKELQRGMEYKNQEG